MDQKDIFGTLCMATSVRRVVWSRHGSYLVKRNQAEVTMDEPDMLWSTSSTQGFFSNYVDGKILLKLITKC